MNMAMAKEISTQRVEGATLVSMVRTEEGEHNIYQKEDGTRIKVPISLLELPRIVAEDGIIEDYKHATNGHRSAYPTGIYSIGTSDFHCPRGSVES